MWLSFIAGFKDSDLKTACDRQRSQTKQHKTKLKKKTEIALSHLPEDVRKRVSFFRDFQTSPVAVFR